MVDFEASPDIVRRFGTLHMALERHDSSIRYREVRFDDPEETLTLPRLIETTSIWRGLGIVRHRRTQEFSDYRRFITGARILRRRRHPVKNPSVPQTHLVRAAGTA